jgi:hypothetical protein
MLCIEDIGKVQDKDFFTALTPASRVIFFFDPAVGVW